MYSRILSSHFTCCNYIVKYGWRRFYNYSKVKVSQKPEGEQCPAEKFQRMTKKLREMTPISKLDESNDELHPYQEKEPLQPFPNGVNPISGEKNGPRGPEPTRYGDWERKGRVTDF